jgi:high affinity sulfate transporter 1
MTPKKEIVKSLLPITEWLPAYQQSGLRGDVMAGLAVWAMTVPQALAYAGIAGVPPIYGLYTVPLAMIAYALFGTSRTLSVGPESAIAIISAVSVGGLAASQDLNEFIALTSLLALVTGVLFILFGLLRLGWIASFLSQPILQGLVQGIALTVIVGQVSTVIGADKATGQLVGELSSLPQLIGIDVDYKGFVLQVWAVLSSLGEANLATTAVGLASLVVLFAFRQLYPFAPSALIASALAILAVWLFSLDAFGVRVIGPVETGMISLSLPVLSVAKIVSLLPGAFAIALLGYAVSLSIATLGAEKTGENVDPDQELVGLGAANLAAAFSSGFVVGGSLSRGSTILRTGGRSQIVSLVNAGLVILTLLIALPFFFNLPFATLSAIVIVAMYGLLDVAYFRRLLEFDRLEFAYGMATLLGVLLLGILEGVALGVVLALAVLIRQVTRPTTAVLGRLPDSNAYRDIAVDARAQTIPGLLIFRFDAPIIFPNASYFADEIRRLISEAPTRIEEVLIPAQQINQLDSTGVDRLEKLNTELAAKGIVLAFAEVKHGVRERMRQTGLEEKIGVDQIYSAIEEGVLTFQQQKTEKPE